MTKSLPADFKWLADMYRDSYFPPHLVDKVKASLETVAEFLGSGEHDNTDIQDVLDKATIQINDLQDEFYEANSELETVARDSIAVTVEAMLIAFDVDIDIETAFAEREW